MRKVPGPPIRWFWAVVTLVLWFLGGWTNATSRILYWAFIELLDGLVAFRLTTLDMMSSAFDHQGTYRLDAAWPIVLLALSAVAVLLAHTHRAARTPQFLRHGAVLAVLFVFVYRSLLYAAPTSLLEIIGQSLVYVVFLYLLLRPRTIEAAATANPKSS